MNLTEALASAKEGNFVTNSSFSPDQSLHYHEGKFYYEDGAVLSRDFIDNYLRKQPWASMNHWDISIPADEVDRDKLKRMHDESGTLMLRKGSYMDCRKQV